MSLTRVPIVPQWNMQNSCVCTQDGGFLYIGSRSINYIGKIKDANTAPIMKVFQTRQTVLGVDVDPGWCSRSGDAEDDERAECDNYFAVLAQDNSIQIWDFDKGYAVRGHKAHMNTARHVEGGQYRHGASRDGVLFGYMSSRKVLSIDSHDLVIYCVASNTYYRRPMFLSSRNQKFTAMRCAPHNENIFALGTSSGLVLVCDLQKMCSLYTFRGHDTTVSSLSWMKISKTAEKIPLAESTTQTKESTPEPVITSDVAKQHHTTPAAASGDDIFDIYDYDYLENEFGAPSKIVSKDEDEPTDEIAEPKELSPKFDFAEACQNLKDDIDALKEDSATGADSDTQKQAEQQQNAVTLEDCKNAPCSNEHLSSCGSTEGSLELIDRSSSSDDVDGSEPKTKQQILHQAEVHASQTLEQKDLITQSDNGDEKENVKEEKAEDGDIIFIKKEERELQSTPNTDVLLASASIDGNFWIWNAETGASCDHFCARGGASSGGGSGNGSAAGKQGKNNIEIAWLSTTELLTTNKQGELTLWTQETEKEQRKDTGRISRLKYKYKQAKRQFLERGVVAFSSMIKTGYLWCISSHREISCENLRTEQIIANYSCAPTNITAMRECPDDMNKIALGFSDHRIGIIDISKMSPTSVYIENFTLRINSPVLSIVWSSDGKKLAFGTVEGRVGILNVENPKQQPYIFNPVCGKQIYSLAWQGTTIYVVCNEALAVYDEASNSKDGHLIPGIQSVSSISVRDNFLFVGTQRGHIQLFRHSSEKNHFYELLQDFEVAARYITEMAWSPIATDQLAVATHANIIQIFTFNTEKAVLIPNRKFEINHVKAANVSIKWSNRNANIFLACGFDGGLRVWDVNNKTNEEKFIKHFPCPMLCGLFLPTDEEIVLCAGRTTSIELIDMRVKEEAALVENAVDNLKRPIVNTLDNVQWAQKMLTCAENKATTTADKRRNKRAAARNDAAAVAVGESALNSETTTTELNSNGNIVAMLNELKLAPTAKTQTELKTVTQCGSSYMKTPATLLYLTTKELNKDALEKMSVVLNTKKNRSPKILCAKLFGKKSEAMELLNEELKNHQHSEGRGISSIFMPQLNANIKEEITKAIQNKSLCEWHVSLAPTISYNFWLKCCQAFAEQLIEQNYALQAATYMIAIHNQNEAIRMLLEKNYFKEALLIARVYLQNDDPLISTIIDKWIAYLDYTGNLTGAALLCTLSGQWNRAYETLAKIRNTQPEIERVLKLLYEKSH